MAGCAGSSRNPEPDKLLLSVTRYNLKEDTTYTVDRVEEEGELKKESSKKEAFCTVEKCGGGNFPFPINDSTLKGRGPMPLLLLVVQVDMSSIGSIVKFLIRHIWRHEEVAHVVRFTRRRL